MFPVARKIISGVDGHETMTAYINEIGQETARDCHKKNRVTQF
jgi:hypothetical protein